MRQRERRPRAPDIDRILAPKTKARAPSVSSDSAAQLRAIYEVVRAIPVGKVATYGQIAALAGIASGHRVAARAMQSCPKGLPWYRVVGKKDARRAQVAIQEGEHASLQRDLLIGEGVAFDAAGFIALRTNGWLPTDLAPARTQATSRTKVASRTKLAPRTKRR